MTSIRALISRELLRHDNTSTPPRYTVMTERGREVVCVVLAEYAEALIAAGALEKMPNAALSRIRVRSAYRTRQTA